MSIQIAIQKLDDVEMVYYLKQHREDVLGYLKTIKEDSEHINSHRLATEFALTALSEEQSKSVANVVSQIFQALRSESLEVYVKRIMQMPDAIFQEEIITCIHEGKSFELKTIMAVASDKLKRLGKDTYIKLIEELLLLRQRPVPYEMLFIVLADYPIPEEEKYTHPNHGQIWSGDVFIAAANSEKRAQIIPALIKNCPEDCQNDFWSVGIGVVVKLLEYNEVKLLKFVFDAIPKQYQKQYQVRIWKTHHFFQIALKYAENNEMISLLMNSCPEDCRGWFWRCVILCLRDLVSSDEVTRVKFVIDACPKKYRASLFGGDYGNLLHDAVSNGNPAMINAVLEAVPKEHRSKLWTTDRYDMGPLHHAILSRNPNAIKAICDGCPLPSKGWFSSKHYKTPFHFAVANGTVQSIEALRSAFPDKSERLWDLSEPTAWTIAENAHRRKMVAWLIENGSDDYLVHHLNVEKKTMSFFIDLIGLLSEQQADRVRNAVDQNGFQLYQYCLIPPFAAITSISTFWPSQLPKPPLLEYLIKQLEKQRKTRLLRQLMKRVVERYPTFEPPAAEENEIRDFIELALASDEKDLVNMLVYDYKMNQSLPLTSVVLKRILEALEKCRDEEKRTAFRLALQTYSYSDFIYSVVDIDKPLRPFPSKAEFLKLTLEEQRALMCRAQVLRQRDALAAAGHILKKAVEEGSYDKDLLIFSLMLYKQTEAEGSKNLLKRFASLFQNEDLDLEIRKQAALAFAKVEQDPLSSDRKQQLFDAYIKTDQEALRSVFLEALSSYSFTSSEADTAFATALVNESKAATDRNLMQSMAYVLSLVPSQEALKESLAIVNSDVWNEIEAAKMLGDEHMISGNYTLFFYRPMYHNSRASMKRIIAERLMLIHRKDKAQSIEAAYMAYKSRNDDFPELKDVEGNIRFFVRGDFNRIQAIQDSVRFYPQNIYLPPKCVLYRGICARKGDELAEVAYDDLFVKGTGSADLTYSAYDKGTWGKIGHVFSTVSLDYVMQGYFDKAGILLTIDGDHLNEAFLRRGARIETESTLHYVSYDTVRHHAITQIFMSRERKERMERISLGSHQAKVETSHPKHSKIQKIMSRRLRAPQKEKGSSLKDRITYFDPDRQLAFHIRDRIDQAGLKETTLDAIVEENVRRQIARRLVSAELKDPELKECMEFAIAQASTKSHVIRISS